VDGIGGLYVLVHNQSSKPIKLRGGINVPSGFETYISVARTFETKQSHPYSDCIDDLTGFSSYSKRIFAYFAEFNQTTYDQQTCIDFCYQDLLIQSCNCSSMLTNAIQGVQYCDIDNGIGNTCMDNMNALFASSNVDLLCQNACPSKCQVQKFDLSTSLLYYPSYNTISDTWVNEKAVFVVNYKDNIVTQIDNFASITADQLLGLIGGNLGLFIGVSLLSTIELFELIFELGALVYRKSKIKLNALRSTVGPQSA
jgi:hypothetical protein